MTPTRLLLTAGSLLVLMLSAGCASKPHHLELDADRTEPEAIGSGSTPQLDPEPEPVEAPPPTEPTTGAEELTVRDDGRPSWWFSETRREGAVATLCAEALGPDMNAARTGAIGAARTRLRRALGLGESGPLPEVTILQTWVWPLPNAATGAANRYAGYVMVEAIPTR